MQPVAAARVPGVFPRRNDDSLPPHQVLGFHLHCPQSPGQRHTFVEPEPEKTTIVQQIQQKEIKPKLNSPSTKRMKMVSGFFVSATLSVFKPKYQSLIKSVVANPMSVTLTKRFVVCKRSRIMSVVNLSRRSPVAAPSLFFFTFGR